MCMRRMERCRRPGRGGVMSVQDAEPIEWERITIVKAKVMAGLEGQLTERQIAENRFVALSTVRTHVEELKGITGCADVKELGRWWRRNRAAWVRWCAVQAGIEESDTG